MLTAPSADEANMSNVPGLPRVYRCPKCGTWLRGVRLYYPKCD